MIRSELVARIAAQNPHLYARDVEAVVKAILDRIGDALADGDRVELRGFGTFSPRTVEAHAGRNPRSGASVQVAAKTSIHFSTGKAMQVRLNCAKIDPGEPEPQGGERSRAAARDGRGSHARPGGSGEEPRASSA